MTTSPVTKAERAKPSSGQRRTRQRAAVEEILSDRHDFRTAQQIHDDLRHHGERIGLTTVYRTLQLMTEPAILMRSEPATVRLRTGAAQPDITTIWFAASAVGRSRSRDLRSNVGQMRSPSSTASGRSAMTWRFSAPAIPVSESAAPQATRLISC